MKLNARIAKALLRVLLAHNAYYAHAEKAWALAITESWEYDSVIAETDALHARLVSAQTTACKLLAQLPFVASGFRISVVEDGFIVDLVLNDRLAGAIYFDQRGRRARLPGRTPCEPARGSRSPRL